MTNGKELMNFSFLLLRFCRFIEILEITIRDAQKKAKHRVIIKHRNGAKETLKSTEKSKEQAISCKRWVS